MKFTRSKTAKRGRPSETGRVLVLGGARSGKSAFAEGLLADKGGVTYVATAPPRPDDPEWQLRVAQHRRRRPQHWNTKETTDLDTLLRGEYGPLLIDCATLWLTAVMDGCEVWEGSPYSDDALAARVDELEKAWRTTRAHVVLVSNEAGCGVVPESAAGRRFRDELGQLNTRLATHADTVWLVTAGIPQRLR